MVRSVVSDKASQHTNPVPNAAVQGRILVTSGVLGKEIDSGEYPHETARQIALVFDYLQAILEEGGATLQDVVKVDLYLEDKSLRPIINEHWVSCWPDEQARPARQAHQATLPDGCCIQLVAMAVLPA